MVMVKRTPDYIQHHGIDGQQWGVRNGPPYPLERQRKLSRKEKKALKKAGSPDVSGIPTENLREMVERLELEERYKDLNQRNVLRGQNELKYRQEKLGRTLSNISKFADIGIKGYNAYISVKKNNAEIATDDKKDKGEEKD